MARLVLLILLTAGPALAQDGRLTLEALAAAVRGRVAKEWTVELRSDVLRLSRAVTAEAADVKEPLARPATFSLVLSVGETLRPKQRSSLMKGNDSLRAKLDALHRRMRAFECDEQQQAWAEGGCFNARSPSELKQVLAYRAMERQFVEVPTHHLGDLRPIRLEVFVNEERRRWYHLVHCDDCEPVEQLLRSLVVPY